jgi:hypothetical protein
MKNSDCMYPTLLRLKVVVPGSTMAPFPPVTGPVTVGFAAEGRGRGTCAALAYEAVATAATRTDAMTVAAAAVRARDLVVTVVRLRLALMACTFHGMLGDVARTECARTVTPLLMPVKHYFHETHTGFSSSVSKASVRMNSR